ncbi:MAG TPA: dihydroorotate dehydrogenase electron transfer subunit [Planctomycetaceae bacterium]|nr:dihydroorotate dehydrogenase electron transfer subunit [Planctomycetaceae bacterium]
MAHFADCAQSITTEILANDLIAQDTRKVRLLADQLPADMNPGQFFMIRIPDCNDPLIGRAFAIYDVGTTQDGQRYLDLVYLVKGKLTSALDKLGPGDWASIWGPLGNGFSTEAVDHLILVAGGVGQTPFLALGKEALGGQQYSALRPNGYADRVSLCYGARTQGYLAGLDDFAAASMAVHIATDDGSAGHHGLVTEHLESLLAEPSSESRRIACCGPEPMMEAVSKIASQHGVKCEVSLETPMACGIGICFTCVAKVGTAGDWDFKRTCIEGPVFDSSEIVW